MPASQRPIDRRSRIVKMQCVDVLKPQERQVRNDVEYVDDAPRGIPQSVELRPVRLHSLASGNTFSATDSGAPLRRLGKWGCNWTSLPYKT